MSSSKAISAAKGRAIGRLRDAWTFVRYSAYQNFSGRSLLFVGLAIAVFLGVVVFSLMSRSAARGPEQVYNDLLIPAILLIFYPAAFAIQSDKDADMIETLFGIPDHRYKVWLVRLATLFVLVMLILFLLALFCRFGLTEFPLGTMVFELMFPVLFLVSLAFFLACLTGSGNSTAVILAVVLLIFWDLAGTLKNSSWFLFHNPFASVTQIQMLVLKKTTLSNRLYLSIGSIFLLMLGLLRLQNREKYI
jgi:hypothetical protein